MLTRFFSISKKQVASRFSGSKTTGQKALPWAGPVALLALALQPAVAQSISPAPPVAPTALSTDSTQNSVYTVVSCNDGDTCRLQGPNNSIVKVRMVGIDAPEFKKSKKTGEAQPFAEKSKEYLNSLLKGKTVRLNSYGTDVYQRTLGELYLGELNVNLQMVKEGYVEVYKGGKTPKGLDKQAYEAAQAEAQKAKKGVWALENYESPAQYRKRNKN